MRSFTQILLITLLLLSCQNKEKQRSLKTVKDSSYSFEISPTKKSQSLDEQQDDFSDLRKKEDESCDDAEEVAKKITAPASKAFQLQGGDPGCSIDEVQ